MTKQQIETHLIKYWNTTPIKELERAVGLGERRIRVIARSLGLPRKTETSTSDEKFLYTAKTEKQLIARFGKTWKSVINRTYPGYTLFTQRNHYNELLYVLLPIVSETIELKPKAFKHHIGKSDDGIEQPYILCQLPNFEGTIKIALLFDVHYGNFAHRHEKFLSYIDWIKRDPNVYAIIGGDLMENALDDGRGMSYDQTQNPSTQFDDMVKFLAPISHKILCATTGNHEDRTYKKTGIDIMRLLAQRLKIPYFSGPIWCSIMANGYKWNLWVSHGFGNSQTKGGKMNSANRPKKFTGLIHFLISGHVHDALAEPETIITDDPINCRLMYLKQWTIIAPSFLNWEDTYAYRAGYPPPARGGVTVELDDTGDYRGSLT